MKIVENIIFWVLELLWIIFSSYWICQSVLEPQGTCCCAQAALEKLGYFRYTPEVVFVLIAAVAPFVRYRILFIMTFPIVFIFAWGMYFTSLID